jgi:Mycoplasma protein of unknown function, DUF285
MDCIAFVGQGLEQWRTSSLEMMDQMVRYVKLMCCSDCLLLSGSQINSTLTMFSFETAFDFQFYDAPSFNGDLSRWSVGRVQSLKQVFRQADSFNSDVSLWDVSKVSDIAELVRCVELNMSGCLSPYTAVLHFGILCVHWKFMEAGRFNSDISLWNTERLITAPYAFFGTRSFTVRRSRVCNLFFLVTL